MKNLSSMLKNRDVTLATKVPSQSYVFYNSHVWMWELDCKEDWAPKNWWYSRRLLRVPWAARSSNLFIIKEINPEYSLEGLMLKLRFQYFGYIMWRTNSLEKTLVLGKVEGRGRKGQQKMTLSDGIIDSIGMSLSKLWKIVKDREAWCAEVHEVTKSDTIEQLNNNKW